MDEENTKKNIGFFEHVFEFKEDTKNDLLNVGQYALLSITPVIGLNKLMKHYIPEADETKGSLEIFIEMIAQILVILIGLFYIHRIITYIPTYSKDSYPPFQLTNLILVILFITLSLQTKLGEKASILYERMMNLINGEDSLKTKEPVKQNPNVTSVLPPPVVTREINTQQPMQHNIGTTPIQNNTDFNQMYQQTTTPMQNAQQPGMEAMGPPPLMAANEALGGSGFGSMF